MTSPISPLITKKETRIEWIVRPAQLEDKDKVDALLSASYGTLLAADYSPDVLSKALPKISRAQETLLTCGTWYVVEDPQTGALVGCGGFTMSSPMAPAESSNHEGGDDGGKDPSPTERPTIMMVPHLRHFATDPAYGRKGIASAIWNRSWNAIVEYCEAQNQPLPAMEVFSTLTAEPFYSSLGFEKVDSMTIPLGEDCDFPATLMRRPRP